MNLIYIGATAIAIPSCQGDKPDTAADSTLVFQSQVYDACAEAGTYWCDEQEEVCGSPQPSCVEDYAVECARIIGVDGDRYDALLDACAFGADAPVYDQPIVCGSVSVQTLCPCLLTGVTVYDEDRHALVCG